MYLVRNASGTISKIRLILYSIIRSVTLHAWNQGRFCTPWMTTFEVQGTCGHHNLPRLAVVFNIYIRIRPGGMNAKDISTFSRDLQIAHLLVNKRAAFGDNVR